MVLPKDPIKRIEALKNIKEAAMKRSLDPIWKENVRQSQIGKIMSEESRKKMSESHKGKHGGEKNPMFGKPAWNKGIPMSEETKRKLSEAKKGKHIHTSEYKKKLSDASKGEKNPFFGKHHTEECIQNMSGSGNPMFGKHPSKETLKKMSKSHIGKCRGPENAMWNDGITPLRKAIRESREMYEWKRKVFERDDYRDYYSGVKGGDLEAHHIIKFEDLLKKYNIKTLDDARNCKELWDVDNGATMRKDIHKAHHDIYGR